MKSHLISQVLLRRFASKNLINVHNLKTNTNELKNPKQIGFIKLPDIEFNKIERKWHSTEKQVNEAFKSLDNGTLLQSPRHLDTIKKIMGIHYLRSKAFFVLLAKTEFEHFDKFIGDVILSHPEKKDEILQTIPAIRKKWVQDLPKNTADVLKSVKTKIENYLSKYELEIGIVDDHIKLILSDNPAINITKDGRMGILSGIAIDQSDGFVMPLGPKHIAALININPSKQYINLSSENVGNINSRAIAQSITEYYSL